MSELLDQHYFVIRGEISDEGEIVFSLDHDTALARFPEGIVWAKHGGWVEGDSTTKMREDDEKMIELLTKKLASNK